MEEKVGSWQVSFMQEEFSPHTWLPNIPGVASAQCARIRNKIWINQNKPELISTKRKLRAKTTYALSHDWSWLGNEIDYWSAPVGGESSASRPGRFTPREIAPVPIGEEAEWALEPVWKTWRRENSCSYRDSNFDPSVIQPVASLYTDWAIHDR
jgi:hypothetical protein